MVPIGRFSGLMADNRTNVVEITILRVLSISTRRYCISQLSSGCRTQVPQASPVYCIGSVWT